MAVMRRLTWDSMSEVEREALCHRGLDDIFDPDLRLSIERLVDDVRLNGDDAVCRALLTFDGIDITPDRLRVSADEIAAAAVNDDVDEAIDVAIANLRTFNESVRARASDWWIESRPGLFVGEKITAITSAG